MQSKSQWDSNFSWQNVLPPSRPSRVQLEHVCRLLNNIPRTERIAVMGSTPEYRDLLSILGFSEVFVIDRSRSFFELMNTMRSTTNHEQYCEQDWLEHFGSSRQCYAAILSDLTSGNIAYDDRHSYYAAIAGALKPDGVFFDKVLLHQKPLRKLSRLQEVFSVLPRTIEAQNYFNCTALFTSEVLVSGVLCTNSAYKDLQNCSVDKNWQRFVSGNLEITPANCKWYYGQRYASPSALYGSALSVLNDTVDHSKSGYDGWVHWMTLGRST